MHGAGVFWSTHPACLSTAPQLAGASPAPAPCTRSRGVAVAGRLPCVGLTCGPDLTCVPRAAPHPAGASVHPGRRVGPWQGLPRHLHPAAPHLRRLRSGAPRAAAFSTEERRSACAARASGLPLQLAPRAACTAPGSFSPASPGTLALHELASAPGCCGSREPLSDGCGRPALGTLPDPPSCTLRRVQWPTAWRRSAASRRGRMWDTPSGWSRAAARPPHSCFAPMACCCAC